MDKEAMPGFENRRVVWLLSVQEGSLRLQRGDRSEETQRKDQSFRRQMGTKMVDSGTGGGENCLCWRGPHEIKNGQDFMTDWLSRKKRASRRGVWDIRIR